MKLDVNNISKYFGEGSNRKKAIEGISFSISSGEFKTLVGSSGSGKSTILRIIAGLESPSKGNVEVDGKIGRYVYKKNKWIFEEGDFNKNVSFNLRLENVIKFIKNKEKN